MSYRYARRISFDEFENRVRRHRPSELVPAIAALTARQSWEEIGPPAERLLLPWILATAAKESLRSGNEHRPAGITLQDLREIAAAGNAVEDPLLDGSAEGQIHAFFTRVAHEQFPYQHSEFQEVARPYAMFVLGAEAVPTEIVKGDFWLETLGCPFEQFQGAGFFLSVAAQRNSGFVDLHLLDRQDLTGVFEEVPAEVIEVVALRHFTRTRDEFREEAERFRSKDSRLRRYDYNPLVGKPLIEWSDRLFVAAINQLVLRKVSTSGLYFTGLESFSSGAEKEAFTRDVGELFQAYVGRQLQDVKGPKLLPEIRYDGGKRSVDWIVIFDGLTLLVEAKSTRLTQDARMGKPTLREDVYRTVGKAFKQINNTYQRVQERHPAFEAIPTNRPVHGMVVTLEPYYFVNNPIIRQMLPQPLIPVQAATIRELEHLVTLSSEESIELFLLQTMSDPERSTWDFAASIGDRRTRNKNRLLAEAFDRFPWKAAAEAESSESPSQAED